MTYLVKYAILDIDKLIKETVMEPEDLVAILRKRVCEFGEKPAYILTPKELATGAEHAILHVQKPEDCGDGTIITKAVFEGKTFICITEKK